MAIIKQVRTSGITYDIVDNSALHTLDNNVSSGGTNAVNGSGIYNAITASSAAVLETVAQAGYQTASDVANLFGAVNYDSATKRINFYHESTTGTVLAYIDATDFIKDSFLESVTIEDVTISGESVTCLVFKWNTESGIEETDIPLEDIFDPTNYVSVDTFTAYTAATDSALSGKQATLVSGTNIKTVNNESLLGSGNITIQGGVQPTVEGETLVFS